MELYYLITISDRDRAEMLSAIYHAAGTGMVLTKLLVVAALYFCLTFPTSKVIAYFERRMSRGDKR